MTHRPDRFDPSPGPRLRIMLVGVQPVKTASPGLDVNSVPGSGPVIYGWRIWDEDGREALLDVRGESQSAAQAFALKLVRESLRSNGRRGGGP